MCVWWRWWWWCTAAVGVPRRRLACRRRRRRRKSDIRSGGQVSGSRADSSSSGGYGGGRVTRRATTIRHTHVCPRAQPSRASYRTVVRRRRRRRRYRLSASSRGRRNHAGITAAVSFRGGHRFRAPRAFHRGRHGKSFTDATRLDDTYHASCRHPPVPVCRVDSVTVVLQSVGIPSYGRAAGEPSSSSSSSVRAREVAASVAYGMNRGHSAAVTSPLQPQPRVVQRIAAAATAVVVFVAAVSSLLTCAPAAAADTVSADVLPDGEVEVRVSSGNVTAKRTSFTSPDTGYVHAFTQRYI